jgi:BASS family bile acid:Na+ symporter
MSASSHRGGSERQRRSPLRWLHGFALAFPLWVTIGSLLALVYPPSFSWFVTGVWAFTAEPIEFFSGGLVTPGLQLIMLSMGLSLRLEDFALVAHQKSKVALGVLLQFTIMPALGFTLARLFALPPGLAAGLILVCACPGGTASNVIAFLAGADVALSVAMTAVSTLLAAPLTPTISSLLIGANVQVDVVSLYTSTAQVVLLPVACGLMLRRYFGSALQMFLPLFPALAVLAIVLIVAGVIGVQQKTILESGWLVLLAVVVTHGLAFLLAYLVAKKRGASERVARTICIEVGMQNSGLGVVLARGSFLDPLVAVTPALSAVVHCLYGSALASFWSRAPAKS